jgi:hypothetical protein
MPTPIQILQGLENIANQMSGLAIAWHIILIGLLIALIAGWRPSIRFIRTALVMPLLSVSVMAWLFGNPFNGSTFLIFAILMIIFGFRSTDGNISFSFGWDYIAGLIIVIFGLVYPHFLHAPSWIPFLYKSPVCLIPCPTLSFVIGLALLIDDLKSRGWYITIIIAGLIYGIIGAFRLGVTIDLVLIAGAVLLIFKVITRKN